jgi:glycosyltransferase involved in cell wall biosynthesis
VFLAVPVYHGDRFVAESLRSMLAQTHTDLSVMISIDGNDRESAEACSPFLGDRRVRMVVQERQLGWVANMNWLIDACDGDFFCYWQQDDLCDPSYIERLVAALADHAGAAAAYSDLRWFGRTDDEVAMPAVIGFTQQRILSQTEMLHWIPLRAVIPVWALRMVGHVRGLDDSIAFSDFLYVLRLAAAGDLIRVPEVLYYKRDHKASTSKNPSSDFHLSEREAWLRLGLEIFTEVAPHFEVSDLPRLAMVICDRLVTARPDRWLHYDAAAVSASEPLRLAADFYRALEARTGVRPLIAADGAGPITVPASVDGWAHPHALGHAARGVLDRGALLAMARQRDALTLDCSAAGVPGLVLGDGWSRPEAWGTWTDGHRARLWLPLPAHDGAWQVRFVGRGYLGAGQARAVPRIIVAKDDRVLLDWVLRDDTPIPAFELPGHGDADGGTELQVDAPMAMSPLALGLGGDDHRLLALGLERVEITRIPGAP